jgi:hypothetical protein
MLENKALLINIGVILFVSALIFGGGVWLGNCKKVCPELPVIEIDTQLEDSLEVELGLVRDSLLVWNKKYGSLVSEYTTLKINYEKPDYEAIDNDVDNSSDSSNYEFITRHLSKKDSIK